LKKNVRLFKNLKIALQELKPFILDGRQILRGNQIGRFDGARPRELVANWLIAVVANASSGTDDFTFTSDPDGDGIIYNKRLQEDWPMEHIIVPPARPGDPVSAEERIRDQVQKKQDKGGAQYARGKTLLVFNELGDNTEWHPNKAARILPKHDFDQVWAVGLLSVRGKNYSYYVTTLDPTVDNVPVWVVHIKPDFSEWTVEQTQSPTIVTVTFEFGSLGPTRTVRLFMGPPFLWTRFR
jgi:hypothetical protein